MTSGHDRLSRRARIRRLLMLVAGRRIFYNAGPPPPPPPTPGGPPPPPPPPTPIPPYDPDVDAAQRKPVLMIGLDYGVYERWQWAQTMLLPNQIDFVNSNTWVDPSVGAGWTPYSAVILCNSPYGTLDATSSPYVLSYLQAGGLLICMESALSAILNCYKLPVPSWAQSWVGFTNSWAEVNTTTYNVSYTASSDVAPWPNDTIASLTNAILGGNWQTLKGPLAGATPLLSTTTETMIGINRVGVNGGAFLFIGRQLFRLVTVPNATPYLAALRQSIVETLANIHASTPTLINIPRLKTDTSITTQLYIPWRRDAVHDDAIDAFAQLGSGPRLSPLYPLASELLDNSHGFSVDLGKNDYTSIPFNIFGIGDLSVQVSVTGSGLPGTAVIVASQDRLKDPGTGVADRTQGAWWLRPVSVGQNVAITRKQNKVFHLTFNSSAWPSISVKTVYNLTLNITDSVTTYAIPIVVNRYPFSQVDANSQRLGFYTFYPWLTDPYQFPTFTGSAMNNFINYSFDPNSVLYPFIGPVMDTAAETGFRSMNMNYMWPSDVVVVDGDTVGNRGLNLSQVTSGFLNANGTVPTLDFSAYDARCASSRARGAYRVQIRNSETDKMIQNLVHVAWTTTTLNPIWKSTFIGIWSQFATYLTGKGFTELAYKFNDEQTEPNINAKWIPMADAINQAGWKAHLNVTGAAVNTTVLNNVIPLAGVLEINETYADTIRDLVAANTITIPPTTVMPIYGSWGYAKGPPIWARVQWWRTFYMGFGGIDIYNYDNDETFTGTVSYASAQMHGHRLGWYDAYWLQYLKTRYTGAGASSWKTSVADLLANSIAPNSTTTPGSPYFHGAYWYRLPAAYGGGYPAISYINATSKQLEQMRHDVFELINTQP